MVLVYIIQLIQLRLFFLRNWLPFPPSVVTELQILTLASDAEKPEVDVSGGKMVLVKVEACSLSAGDVIMLSGAVDKVRKRVYHLSNAKKLFRRRSFGDNFIVVSRVLKRFEH